MLSPWTMERHTKIKRFKTKLWLSNSLSLERMQEESSLFPIIWDWWVTAKGWHCYSGEQLLGGLMGSAKPKCPLLQHPPQPLLPTTHGRTGSSCKPPPSLSHHAREEPWLPTATKAVVVCTAGSSSIHRCPAEQPALSIFTAFVFRQQSQRGSNILQ